MLFKVKTKENRALHGAPVALEAATVHSDDRGDEQVDKRRQRMYERIARGNALAEAEENAHRKWRGSR